MGTGDQRGMAISIRGLTHRYGDRVAVDGVQLEVENGEIFGLLGPNGGGKTTLFRVVSTLFALQDGEVSVRGYDLRTGARDVRAVLGVVFQSPALDQKLRVEENLTHQGHLYGMWGRRLRARIDELLMQLRIEDRAQEIVENLSGGLQRRVEIAKALLHKPKVLLMDEPSTGLDPGARLDLWALLQSLRKENGMTILLTTHLMEEAERCDRIGIMHAARLVVTGNPGALRGEIGGEVLSIATPDPVSLAGRIHEQSVVLGRELRIEHPQAAELLLRLKSEFGDEIESATLSRPTLEDVFIRHTGRRLDGEDFL